MKNRRHKQSSQQVPTVFDSWLGHAWCHAW